MPTIMAAGLCKARPLLKIVHAAVPTYLIPVASMAHSTASLHNKFVIHHPSLVKDKSRPILVLMYGFYGATDRAIEKYSDIYHGYGFDVLPVKSRLKHFAWPKCSTKLARQTLTYLQENCQNYEHYLVHAFSMGAYNFTVLNAEMYDKPDMYSNIQKKICGIVYDSLAIGSLDGMIKGVASGISTNKVVQWTVPKTMSMYYFFTHRHTVAVYDHVLDIAKNSPLPVPTLCFYSKNDLLSRYDVIESWFEEWREKRSIPVQLKFWEKSRHSAHLLLHEEEYLQALDKYVKSVPALVKDIKTTSKM